MLDEAASAGAHGIVGVVDTSAPLADMGVVEFRVQGTAVRVVDGEPPADGRPWTTYLAGQRLAKLVEAGYAPVSIAATVASVGVWANCVTQYLTEGTTSMYRAGNPATRSSRPSRPRPWPAASPPSGSGASSAPTRCTARRLATTKRELGEGDAAIECILRGNRVRRFRDFDPMPAPRPTVRLL